MHVNEAWERFMAACRHAQREMGAGRPEPFKAVWSHADDVAMMGGSGGYERGGSRSVPVSTGLRKALQRQIAARETS